jgi:glutathione synthase/RimK-type ligase-like ATP-grasp enzyme
VAGHIKEVKSVIKIAICVDHNDWHGKFRQFIKLHARRDDLIMEFVRINHDNWMDKLKEFDAVIWKSSNMGPEASGYFKEKIYFIEHYLCKLVVPNYNTIWHFESKAAQSYIFRLHSVPIPRTVATFDVDNALALLKETKMPLVVKKSFGAASKNVRLIKSANKMRAYIKTTLCRQMIERITSRHGRLIASSTKYLVPDIIERKVRDNNQRCVYWQELVPGNSRDLRITVIGDRYAFAFWRNNRPNDFRASGSGNIDYVYPVPIDVVCHCIALNKKFDFDSMAYDIVFKDGDYKIIEISYGYIDKAIYNTPGYYCLQDGQLEFNPGHFWPQELWAKWLLLRIDQKLGNGHHA